ncbi:MAG: mechanosensitive ion channel family protein [Bacteroidales bacterium]|nr:mechanosensitive ion channel family protein [Bacteroidales bacterium]
MIQSLKDLLLSFGLSQQWAEFFKILISFIVLFGLAYVSNYITKRFIYLIFKKIVKKTPFEWDDILLKNKFFYRFSHIVPALLIYIISPYILTGYPKAIVALNDFVYVYFVVMGVFIVSAFLDSVNDIYMQNPISKDRPIKGILQVINIVNFLIGIVLIISIIFHKNPTYFLTGIGALSAVLLLIFKDTLLGLTAGFQLSSNKMIKIGDWISIPQKNVDGIVTEITLHTVKIENWDKSIAMIPSYTLANELFINYEAMLLSQARRIKRSLFIDINTVKFLSLEEIENLKNVELLRDYLNEKLEEIKEYNKNHNFDLQNPINGRWLTNIGTFRIYAYNYLLSLEHIRKDLTCMVRQLPPSENGIPLEIYAFSNYIDWHQFERAQADIFDHLMAVIPIFNLKIYQNPTGNDFAKILR